jgi:hypothetical protein
MVVAGDTCVSAQGLATIVGRDKRYQVCRRAHGFDAGELIRKHQPDVLLIEPFLEDRDGIWWIKDLATEFPRTRILIVSLLVIVSGAARLLWMPPARTHSTSLIAGCDAPYLPSVQRRIIRDIRITCHAEGLGEGGSVVPAPLDSCAFVGFDYIAQCEYISAI